VQHAAKCGVLQTLVCWVRKRSVRSLCGASAFVLVAILFCIGAARADGSGDPTAVKQEDGKYYDKQGNPTYSIKPDGTVDWYTYSGFIRYHSECHVCHGPDGLGSSYAPALTDSLKTMSYSDFLGVVASGRKDVNTANDKVMPAFGDNKNVMCVIDDIYVYLRARANNALGRGRPEKHADKPEAAAKAQDACFGVQ
jgi:methanol metabolism-related c-type cytochrome